MKKTLTFSALLVGLCLTAAIGWRLLKTEKQTPMVYAGTGENVTGYAWSENIGWISFNSLNCDKNPENNIVDTDAQTPGCAGNGASTTISYGVNLDKTTGDFSGYAWSDNVGWIYFGPDSAAATTSSSAPNNPKTWPHFDRTTGKITGWAYILSMGNDGWIKMGDDSLPVWADKGVKISTTTSPIGDFHGWAWNGNDASGTTTDSGIGWISFNCADAPGGCTASSTYAVHTELNARPTISNMTHSICSSPNVGCFGTNAYLSWTYNDTDTGSAESGYQLVLSTNSDMSSPLLDTGHCTGYNASNKCAIDIGVDRYIAHDNLTLPAKINYDTLYYWQVKVWDNMGADSGFATSSFRTGKHELPDAVFSYLPAHPTSGQKIVFKSNSRYYRTVAPATFVNCDDANCSYKWTFSSPVVFDAGSDDISSSTTVTYNGTGNLTVWLTVTDHPDLYSSTSTPQTLPIGMALPTIIEKK